jgi:hypothetical protein
MKTLGFIDRPSGHSNKEFHDNFTVARRQTYPHTSHPAGTHRYDSYVIADGPEAFKCNGVFEISRRRSSALRRVVIDTSQKVNMKVYACSNNKKNILFNFPYSTGSRC